MTTRPNATHTAQLVRIEDLDAIATPSGTDLILFMTLRDESGDSVEVTDRLHLGDDAGPRARSFQEALGAITIDEVVAGNLALLLGLTLEVETSESDSSRGWPRVELRKYLPRVVE